ncbi:thyrostimulin alpha-2 subunit [Cimex lectularius]|uniref:DAN domain-containing protein n=1 Tax=Cimex lectularius TaxID=79782 RepID=A0A8I6RIC1_CIMLE|nr:thyrostimulin alpha-2 subunit [Cimex lectularius]
MYRLILALLLCNLASAFGQKDSWEKPGCSRVAHSRKVSIPDCVEFYLTTNACIGYCESWAVPSPPETIFNNPLQGITSIGQCCNMIETEDVSVTVRCLDETKELIFKSAKSCSCYHCKKD